MLPLLLAQTAGAAAGVGATGGATMSAGAMAGGGMGAMMFGQQAGAYNAGASSGLFGSGGQFGLGQTMNTIGMGLGLASAMGTQGAGVQGLVRLSKSGKKLEKNLYEDTQAKLTGTNLAEPYVKAYRSSMKGKLKRRAGEQERATRGLGGELGTRDVRTGKGAASLVASAGANIEGKAAPAIWEQEFIRGEKAKGITGAQNILAEQRQIATIKAGTDLTNAGLGRLRGAEQGQALGDMARYLAYQKYPPYQGRRYG